MQEEIDPRKLLIKITKILKELQIPYMVTGGIAVLIWGRPRFTADIDIIIELKKEGIQKLEAELKKLNNESSINIEAMKDALERMGEFNFIDGNTGIKVDFWILKDDEFDKSRIKRRIVKKIMGENINVISPEDLILIKLKWFKDSESSRQLEDVESIIKISGKILDKIYLQKWAKRLGVLPILNKITKKSSC